VLSRSSNWEGKVDERVGSIQQIQKGKGVGGREQRQAEINWNSLYAVYHTGNSFHRHFQRESKNRDSAREGNEKSSEATNPTSLTEKSPTLHQKKKGVFTLIREKDDERK